jgi:outer membrane protein TolC
MFTPRWIPVIPILVLLLSGMPRAQTSEQTETPRPIKTVGIVFDGLHPESHGAAFERLPGLGARVQRETDALTRRQFDVRFPESKQLSGNWTVEGIRGAVDRLMADPEVDIVVGLGIFTTTDICRRRDLPKPTVAALAIDMEAQALPVSSNRQGQMTSGVPNLNFVLTRGSIMRDIARFRDTVPFKRVHVLADALVNEAIPEITNAAVAGGRRLGVEMVLVSVTDAADQALDQLPTDAEAVYVTPMNRLSRVEFDRLIAGLIERRLPSFSLWGREEVEAGIMAGVRPAADISRLSRRMALNIQRILQGEDAGELPVELELQGGLVINMKTAQAIGYYPRFSIAREAELLHPEAVENLLDQTLTSADAVRAAVAANVTLEAGRRSVAAGALDIDLARSALRPEIAISGTAVRIDDDRAAASFGSQAETTVGGALSVSQLLYSDSARAGVEISRLLQDSREMDYQVARLDVALETAIAFLNVLRAQVLERVALENRRLTESNLELARKREQIGFSGPADVYRWESELATDRSEVNRTHSLVHSAFLQLNLLMHAGLEPMFEADPPSLEDPELVAGFGRLSRFVDNAATFALFRDFSVNEGLANSPELAALDSRIAAQERLLRTARRSYWSPDVAVVGELDRSISRSGEGSEGNPLPGAVTADRDNWSVAVEARLPLLRGGARKAEVSQAAEELSGLRLLREATRESIEFRIRTTLFGLSATYLAIELSRQANEAAGRNLELVTDSYSRGAVSIIELLDAQNASLVSDEFASNAVFDFLVDLMRTQRATNNFDFFNDEHEREAWFERLEAYFADAGFGLPAAEVSDGP